MSDLRKSSNFQETQEQLVDEELKNMQISTRPEDTKRGGMVQSKVYELLLKLK